MAQTRRVLFAKQLIHDSRLPMAEIASAAGFGSVRRFNETFQQLFRRPPSALRRRTVVVDLLFPKMLPSASLSEAVVLVSRFRTGYRVWEVAH